MPYKLSATLLAHSADVRAVASPTNELVLSASRDTTAISWQRAAPGQPFQASQTIRPGHRYVNAVAYLPPSSTAPQGYILTAGQEMVINAFPVGSSSSEPEYSLVGHEDNVCALDVSPTGAIISGSWDRTAKVWINFKLAHTLKGHEQAVWAVQIVAQDQFLTASADKTIKLWDQHKLVRSFEGHTDAVRGLALIPDIGFASCSNDSEVRVWTLGGDCVHTLSGHTSYVYSISVFPNGDIVSGGEDRTVRVWRDGVCAQTIVHPAISVWTVSTMPNGDIVSGCSDGAVRVFSASEERWASEEDIKSYSDTVAEQQLPSQTVGDLKKSDIAGVEALDTPGKKDGETKIVKRRDVLEAHQWDSTTSAWTQMGTVVDAVGEGRKQLDKKTGKEYDYIFDVDIKDGAPPLKLPYNVSENPYMAAQRFLEQNELPSSYLDQVVKFIETNTAGVTLGSGGNEYVDPYTGASRYQSNANSVPTPSGGYQDPYTGASRYQSNSNSVPTGGASQYRDPFTGASAYTTQTATPPPEEKAADPVLPQTKYIYFKTGNVTAMQGKIHQFHDALRHEISTANLAMYPEETRAFDAICEHLQQVSEGPTMPQDTPAVTTENVESIIHVLERWPMSQRFPVFDLSRLVLGYCPEVFRAPGLRAKFLDTLFATSEWTVSWSQPLSKPQETILLLLLRGLGNVFQDVQLLEDGESVGKVLTALSQIRYDSLTRFQRTALASILYNHSCLGLSAAPTDVSLRAQHVNLILNILQSEKKEAEVVYRALVGLGNIAYSAKEHDSPLDADQIGMAKILAQSLSFTDARIKGVMKEIIDLL